MLSYNFPFDDFGVFYPQRSRRAIRGRDTNQDKSSNALSTRTFPGFLINEPDLFNFNWEEGFENFKVEEEPDKYVVTYTEPNFKNKEFEVNFLKKENTLVVKTSESSKKSGKGNETTFSSTSEASVSLEKPVKFEDIQAESKENSIVFSVPKVEKDKDESENIHKIELNKQASS